MAKKLKSDRVKHIKTDRQANKSEKKAPPYWNSEILAFEWWELAPDGFCSSPSRKRRSNPKP